MAASWRQLITSAHREIGVGSLSGQLGPEEIAEGKFRLEALLGSWSVEGLFVPLPTRLEVTVTQSRRSYTVGEGGDIEGPPVAEFHAVAYRHDGETNATPIDRLNERSFTDRDSVDSIYPSAFFFERGPALSTLKFNGATQPNDWFRVRYDTYLGEEIADIEADTGLRGEHHRAIILNLAVEVAPMYSRVRNLRRTERSARTARATMLKGRLQPGTQRLDRMWARMNRGPLYSGSARRYASRR